MKKVEKKKPRKLNNDEKNELAKDLAGLSQKYDLLGFWIATSDSEVDWFYDLASMHRFFVRADIVRESYNENVSLEAMKRRPKGKNKDFSGDDYFG